MLVVPSAAHPTDPSRLAEPQSPDPAVLSTSPNCAAPTPPSQRHLVHLTIAPARNERGHAAHGVRAALVAGLDQQLGVRAHERRRHRDRVTLGKHGIPAPCPELLNY